MAKKLTEDVLENIIDEGIKEFANKGYELANTNTIAKNAGISVGVLFKYFENKETFFLACLKKSLEELDKVISSIQTIECDALGKVEYLIRKLVEVSDTHEDYIKMYHTITSTGNHELAEKLAEEIEGTTSKFYKEYIRDAQDKGEIRKDITPEMAAFFFDNLLMMLQFSLSCDYYKKRLDMYLDKDGKTKADFEEGIISGMLNFIKHAFEV